MVAKNLKLNVTINVNIKGDEISYVGNNTNESFKGLDLQVGGSVGIDVESIDVPTEELVELVNSELREQLSRERIHELMKDNAELRKNINRKEDK